MGTNTPSGEDYQTIPTNVAYAYDRGNLTEIVRNANESKQMGYHMTYDDVGKRTGVYWSGKSDTKYTLQTTSYHDWLGVPSKTEYGNGDTMGYYYNRAGLLTTRLYEGKTVATYEYNANNNLGASTYYRPYQDKYETTHYFYDPAGRVSGTENTLGMKIGEITYDMNNNMTSYLSSLDDGQVKLSYYTYYTYNSMNALTKLQLQPQSGYESGTIRYGYDGLGRMNVKKAVLVGDDTDTTDVNEEVALTTTFTYKETGGRFSCLRDRGTLRCLKNPK